MNYRLADDTLLIAVSSLRDATVADFLNRLFAHSKKTRYKIIHEHLIKLDGHDVSLNTKLIGHQLALKIYETREETSSCDLKIVYEDELFLIVDKPKGIIVHSDHERCLNDLVKAYFKEALPVHRLDKETDGLIMYVKSPLFLGECSKMIEDKKIKRAYIAIVKGRVEGAFWIDKAIGKDRHDARKRRIYPKGQKAQTFVKAIQSYADHSVLRCELKTGRTHQIRVHLESIHHPILNDELYGASSTLIEGMGLSAYELVFYHPLKEEEIKVAKAVSF